MHRISRKGIVAVSVLFGVAVFFLLAVSALSWISRAAINKSQAEFAFLQRVDREMIRLKLLAVNAETGQRGYLITGDAAYLEPYSRAMAEKEAQMETLSVLLDGRVEFAEDLPELYELIDERDEELFEAITMRRNENFESAQQLVAADFAKQLTDRIRIKIDEMRAELSRQMETSGSALKSNLNRGTIITNLISVAALLSGLVGLALLIQQMRSHAETLELERDRERAERADREKSRFLASMSHEIRTPLNAMLGFTELLDTEVKGEKGRKYLRTVRESGESLIELINDVLDLSKIESGILELDPEPVNMRDFADTIEALFEPQAKEGGLDYEVDVRPECPKFLEIDSLRFRQILVNLVGNALKFTNKGSVSVVFDAENRTSSDCTLSVRVRDTGRGIPEAAQKSIFKPFRQAKAEDEMIGGTGLGLSISQELARLMGGKLTLESEENVGSTFKLTLPNVEIAEEVEAEFSREENNQRDFDLLVPSSVLVVDDNPFNRDLVAGYLEGSHHKTSFASNGKEALEQIARVEPDVVLMDIRMPVMDGQEARKRIKADEGMCNVPVIAVTASSLLRQEKTLRKQFDGYLRKPFSRAELFSALNRAIPIISEPEENIANPVPAEPVEKVEPIPRSAPPEELREKLAIIHEERWQSLTSSMAISEVVETSNELERLGESYSYSPLVDYAKQIRSHAESFEQSKLEKALTNFVEFVGPKE